jgi:hypothetical protein
MPVSTAMCEGRLPGCGRMIVKFVEGITVVAMQLDTLDSSYIGPTPPILVAFVAITRFRISSKPKCLNLPGGLTSIAYTAAAVSMCHRNRGGAPPLFLWHILAAVSFSHTGNRSSCTSGFAITHTEAVTVAVHSAVSDLPMLHHVLRVVVSWSRCMICFLSLVMTVAPALRKRVSQ